MSMDQEKEDADKGGSFQTIIIGGGQAGLAAGYFLAHHKENFIILDKDSRTGDTWRKRWDSLRLFTPSKFDRLPGMHLPYPENYMPTKDEVAGYLEEYARKFALPIRHDVKVEALRHSDQGYQVLASGSNFKARNVIVATGQYQLPHTPALAGELSPGIFQMHSSGYSNPQQVPARSVLVVGAGNSGAEIALELRRAGKQVWLAGRDVGQIPINTPFGKAFKGKPMWWFMGHVLTVNTPVGRKVRESTLHRGGALGRITRSEVAASGVDLVPSLTGVQSGQLKVEDGRVIPADGVIWATGFRPDYRWIELPIFDEHGLPRHRRGVVQSAPGLYFLGMFFQTALRSSLMGGVGDDAAYIAGKIVNRPS
jgi:putative flavoprotein involved in K+ transport